MKDLNRFRAIDALEYADAMNRASSWTADEIREHLRALHERSIEVEAVDGVKSYLLAAYRGYEDALSVKTGGRPSEIVTLDQSA